MSGSAPVVLASDQSTIPVSQSKSATGTSSNVSASTSRGVLLASNASRLGAALYGLNKLDEALVAYNKANDLEQSDIYKDMIEQIKSEVTQIKNKLIKLN